jgi:hypothetical protein
LKPAKDSAWLSLKNLNNFSLKMGILYILNFQLYLKFSLHIYDVKEYGKYHDGFNSGNVTFKVRLFDENPEFNLKLNDITSKIGKLGLSMKKNEPSKKKPM